MDRQNERHGNSQAWNHASQGGQAGNASPDMAGLKPLAPLRAMEGDASPAAAAVQPQANQQPPTGATARHAWMQTVAQPQPTQTPLGMQPPLGNQQRNWGALPTDAALPPTGSPMPTILPPQPLSRPTPPPQAFAAPTQAQPAETEPRPAFVPHAAASVSSVRRPLGAAGIPEPAPATASAPQAATDSAAPRRRRAAAYAERPDQTPTADRFSTTPAGDVPAQPLPNVGFADAAMDANISASGSGMQQAMPAANVNARTASQAVGNPQAAHPVTRGTPMGSAAPYLQTSGSFPAPQTPAPSQSATPYLTVPIQPTASRNPMQQGTAALPPQPPEPRLVAQATSPAQSSEPRPAAQPAPSGQAAAPSPIKNHSGMTAPGGLQPPKPLTQGKAKPAVKPWGHATPAAAPMEPDALDEDSARYPVVEQTPLAEPVPVPTNSLYTVSGKGKRRGWLVPVAAVALVAVAIGALALTGVLGRWLGTSAGGSIGTDAAPNAMIDIANGLSAPDAAGSGTPELSGISVEPASATAPAELVFTLQTNNATSSIRLLTENGDTIYTTAFASPKDGGREWIVNAKLDEPYAGDVRVFLRDGVGKWSAGEITCKVDVR